MPRCPHSQLIRYWMNQLRLYSWKKYKTEPALMAKITAVSEKRNRIEGAKQRRAKAKKRGYYKEKNRVDCREYYKKNRMRIKLRQCLKP